MMSNEERKAIKLALTLTAITILAFVAILVMTTISSPVSDPSPFGLA